jgi:gliding motility-associated-like protein
MIYSAAHNMVETQGDRTIVGDASKGIAVETGSFGDGTWWTGGANAFTAVRRWPAYRLKQYMDEFAKEFGFADQGGVGVRIRAVLAGQAAYGVGGDYWFIGNEGVLFLEKQFGLGSAKKYLYGLAIAAYTGIKTDESKSLEEVTNLSVAEIIGGLDATTDELFGEFGQECQGDNCEGNEFEDLLGFSKRYGLKMMAYEGGPEANVQRDGAWVPMKNIVAAYNSPGMYDHVKKFMTKWYSWMGYDALFIKNNFDADKGYGAGYAVSEKIGDNSQQYRAYRDIIDNPAPPLTKDRGGVIGVNAVTTLPGNKTAGYDINASKSTSGRVRTYFNADHMLAHDPKVYLLRNETSAKYKISFEYNYVSGVGSPYEILLNDKVVSTIEFPWSFGGPNKFTEPVLIDIPYGTHAFVIRVPLTETREYGVDLNNIKFEIANENPPAIPDLIYGDLTVCKGNTKAKYEVSPVDFSVCDYVWSGLPTTATILTKTTTNPVTGQGVYKMFVDWGSTPNGVYDLTVVAKNQSKLPGNAWLSSGPRLFKVTVQTCGFEINPTPICVNQNTTFTPSPMAGVTEYRWDLGPGAGPDRSVLKLTNEPVVAKYTTEGKVDVKLITKNSAGEEKIYYNVVNVSNCSSPVVVSPVTYCTGTTASALIATASPGGATLKWYTTANGGTGSPEAPVPATTSPGTTSYWVTQMNNGGTVESARSKIEVTVIAASLGGTATPSESTIAPGGNTNITLDGHTGTFKWQKSTDDVTYTDVTPAVTGPILNTGPLTTAGDYYYRAVLTNATCPTANSTVAKVTVALPSSAGIVSTTTSAICSGAIASLKIENSNGNIHWQDSIAGGAFADVSPAATGPTYSSIALTKDTWYRVRVTESSGNIYSNAVKITVSPAGAGGIATASAPTISPGENTVITLVGHSGTIKWQKSTDDVAYTDVTPPATEASLNTGPLATAGDYYYRAVVASGTCPAANSVAAKVTVIMPSNAGIASTNSAAICSGTTASLKLEDYSGTIHWQDSIAGGVFVDVSPAATDPTYSAAPTKDTWYRARVTTTGDLFSNPVKITVSAASAGGTATASAPIISPEANTNITLAGHTGIIKWQKSTDDVAYTDVIPPATEASLNTGPLGIAGDYYYRAVVTSGACPSANSVAAKVRVTMPSNAGKASTTTAAICSGATTSLKLEDYSGTIHWQDSIAGGAFADVSPAATDPTYSVAPTKDIWYRARVTTTGDLFSNVVAITVNPLPIAYKVSGGASGCGGDTTSADIKLSNSETGVSYYLSGTSQVQPGTTGLPLTFEMTAVPKSNDTYKILAVSVANCEQDMDGEATIAIDAGVGEPIINGNDQYCNKEISLLTGAADNATLKTWSISPATAGTIDNGTITWNATFTGPVTITLSVSNTACSTLVKSNTLQTVVNSVPEINTLIGDTLVCRGNVATYLVNHQTATTYDWSINMNTTIEGNDTSGKVSVKFLDNVSDEGAILTVTPRSGLCGQGPPKTIKIHKDKGCDLFVPNVLTPGTADGNSVWQLEGFNNFPMLKIDIFNRWGSKIHSQIGKYDKPWDGTTDGKPLPTATYYYIIDKQDGSEKVTGSVTVLRD